MIYTVIWIKPALNALANIWNLAPDRQAVTQASHLIDQELRVDAHRKGLPLGSGRFLLRPPLAVTFKADPGDCMVRVLQVKRFP
jgi:hypothetical protein